MEIFVIINIEYERDGMMFQKGSYGFTLIELLAVIVILAVVMLIATPTILNIIEDAKKGSFKNSVYGIIKAAEYNHSRLLLKGQKLQETIYVYTNGVETSIPSGNKLEFKGTKPQNGIIIISDRGEVKLAIHDGNYCVEKGYSTKEVTLANKTKEECIAPYIVFDEAKGVNKPQLTVGMTPIKWNGTSWINTTENDTDWYDYENKKWANTKTADGSFWVWIPRYAYSITTGYHTSTAGTISIKFLKGKTNESSDGTSIELTPTYSGSSQTNFVKHPAFEFDGETTGFWVAKFEPSGTSVNINVLPNVASLRSMTIGDQFDAAYNMRNNAKYGWTSNDVETYMMKNSEWGAVAYLSKSIYGANTEIWINNSSAYTTGCAGNSVSEVSFAGCQNTYNTTTGQKASTTHNIYGIYDMSGGAYERVSAYINNGNSNLTTYGTNILNASIKYKNVYVKGITDTGANNYTASGSIFGEAVYETSTGAVGSTSWYGDYSYIPNTTSPWFYRGGNYDIGSNAGAFNFYSTSGNVSSINSFRPVVRPVS